MEKVTHFLHLRCRLLAAERAKTELGKLASSRAFCLGCHMCGYLGSIEEYRVWARLTDELPRFSACRLCSRELQSWMAE